MRPKLHTSKIVWGGSEPAPSQASMASRTTEALSYAWDKGEKMREFVATVIAQGILKNLNGTTEDDVRTAVLYSLKSLFGSKVRICPKCVEELTQLLKDELSSPNHDIERITSMIQEYLKTSQWIKSNIIFLLKNSIMKKVNGATVGNGIIWGIASYVLYTLIQAASFAVLEALSLATGFGDTKFVNATANEIAKNVVEYLEKKIFGEDEQEETGSGLVAQPTRNINVSNAKKSWWVVE